MIKRFISALCLVVSLSVFSYEEPVELPPLDPKYEGVHGMVLYTANSRVFAHHLPMYHEPHNVQLIYQLEVKDVNLLQLIRDAKMVTIKPEPFNLQRLMRGEELSVTADVYMGHFERDGLLTYEQSTIKFAKQIYFREMTDVKESNRLQEFDVVDLNKNYKLYIHKIAKAPSYEGVMHIDVEATCLNRFTTSSAVPTQNELLYKFINCGTIKPLYYETQDFEVKVSTF